MDYEKYYQIRKDIIEAAMVIIFINALLLFVATMVILVFLGD